MGSQLRQAVSSLDSARADNLALVERLRYVQGYRAQTRGKGKIMYSQFMQLGSWQMPLHIPARVLPYNAMRLGALRQLVLGRQDVLRGCDVLQRQGQGM